MAREGPTREMLEEGQKVAYATGLHLVNYVLEELCERFQHSDEARERLMTRAHVLDPLLKTRVCMEFEIKTVEGTSKVYDISYDPAANDYSIFEQMERIHEDEELTPEQKELRLAHLRGRLSFLVYVARNAWQTFVKDNKDFLLEILGASVDEKTRDFIIRGGFMIDGSQMLLKAFPGGRSYGIHIVRRRKD
jgi:hypothetical protein